MKHTPVCLPPLTTIAKSVSFWQDIQRSFKAADLAIFLCHASERFHRHWETNYTFCKEVRSLANLFASTFGPIKMEFVGYCIFCDYYHSALYKHFPDNPRRHARLAFLSWILYQLRRAARQQVKTIV